MRQYLNEVIAPIVEIPVRICLVAILVATSGVIVTAVFRVGLAFALTGTPSMPEDLAGAALLGTVCMYITWFTFWMSRAIMVMWQPAKAGG